MSEEFTNTPQPSANNTSAQEGSDTVDLTLNDLVTIKSMIDVASNRGAFKPNEMVAVGTIYNKLEKFLELAAKQNQANQAQQNQANQAQQNQAAPNA